MSPVMLLIEDEAPLRKMLRATLPGHGYELLEASTGAEGLALAQERQPTLILLDLGLPDMDGRLVLERIREHSAVPILVLSARGQEREKVSLLDAGADDYLTKPFSMNELLARLRVALRGLALQGSATESAPVLLGDLCIDRARRQVLRGGVEVHLTPLEHKLLEVLLRHRGKVLTHQQLLREVWGASRSMRSPYLHVHVGHLRAKLEENPARPHWLLTEPGVGYWLRAE